MASTSISHNRGLWQTTTAFFQFTRFFKNWKEVWSAYRRRTPLPPLVLNTGLTLIHDPADDPIRLFREFFVDRRYTSNKFYNPRCGDVVVDLGGKSGFFALSLEWMARGVRIHSFEPAADSRSRLKRNVTSNRLNPFITVYPFVVGVPAGDPQLQTAGKAGLQSLDRRTSSSFSLLENLPTLTLTEAIDLTSAAEVDLLKVESEGHEVQILEGADHETWSKIRRVVVKYHENLNPGSCQRIREILHSEGFNSIETLANRRQPYIGLIRASRER